jgi:hypothetical protein
MPIGLLVVELRERHIGSIATWSGHDGSRVTVDAGALVRRLLLFEHCTLESDYLVEIPRLVSVFGFKGLGHRFNAVGDRRDGRDQGADRVAGGGSADGTGRLGGQFCIRDTRISAARPD